MKKNVNITRQMVHECLAKIEYSSAGTHWDDLQAVRDIRVTENGIELDLKLGFLQSQKHLLAMQLAEQLEKQEIANIQVNIESEVLPSPSLERKGQLKNVANILMVASGKGGVGKSTTAINLALALQAEGAKVGILDADIYGPSLRTMLGVAKDTKPELVDQKYVKPISKYGLKAMSVAFLSESKTPMIWRGPMAVRALQQLLEYTLWGELDYLIIDMPPGTGDIHISLAQKVSVSAAVVVTTPQEMALVDARKGVEMFNKVGIPVLGIVENMGTHRCSNCGHEEAIFGTGGAETLAEQYEVPLLGSLPLQKQVREQTDAGAPTVISQPNSEAGRAYLELANCIGAQLWRVNLKSNPAPQIQIVES